MKRYGPPWERLPDAVNRVMATGLSEAEAKSDLCRAISDRAVKIRLQPGKNPITGMTSHGTVLDGEDVEIPVSLSAEDVDWNNSRPRKTWPVRSERELRLKGHWLIEWIEVSTQDVTRILCKAEGGHEQGHERSTVNDTQRGRRRGSPGRDRARDAIKELYPNGVPGQAAVPNAILCRRVGEKLKQAKLPGVSADTILRAAGRRK